MSDDKDSSEIESRPFRAMIPDVSGIDLNKISKSQNPDFIPYNTKGRDIMGRMFQFTGIAWLTGFSLGSLGGIGEGWRSAVNPSFKVRINSVMNAMSKRGSRAGNALGVLSFMHTFATYVCEEGDVDSVTGTRWATPALAGFLTGAIYKSTASPRACILAGAIGAGGSTLYSFGAETLYSSIFGRKGRYR